MSADSAVPARHAATSDDALAVAQATARAEEEALMQRYAAGETQAARLLIDRLAPRALRVARRLLQDPAEAEDVAQEAMLRLWQIAPRWQTGRAAPSTWLHRVAVNLATDRLRRRRATGLDDIDEPAAPEPEQVDAMIAADRARALDMALASLPARQRAAVVLRHLEGYTNPQIAEVLGVGVEAVESLTARGKRQLAAYLAPRRDELGFEQ